MTLSKRYSNDSTYDPPEFWQVGLSWIGTSLFVALTVVFAMADRGIWYVDGILILVASVAVLLGFVTLVLCHSMVVYRRVDLTKAKQNSRVEHTIRLANALAQVDPRWSGTIARHDGVIEIIAHLRRDQRAHWIVRTEEGDVPFEFLYDFLNKSRFVAGYLWPVRRAGEIELEPGKPWPNATRLAGWITNMFIVLGWAEEQSGGPYSAKLIVPLEYIAEKCDVQLKTDLEETE